MPQVNILPGGLFFVSENGGGINEPFVYHYLEQPSERKLYYLKMQLVIQQQFGSSR
jgi:hypothetical protein